MQDPRLAKIVEEIIGPRPRVVTLVPYKRELVSPGPNMEVYFEYPELVPTLDRSELPELFYQTLVKCESLTVLEQLARVNNFLLGDHAESIVASHDKVNGRFLRKDLLEEITKQQPNKAASHSPFRIVFHRLSLLVCMKLIFGLSNHDGKTLKDDSLVGEIALLANSFIGEDKYENDQDLILHSLPTWEISNLSDMAYSMARFDVLIRDQLLGPDPEIAALRGKLELEVERYDGLLLDEYLTLIFGLYSLVKENPGVRISSASVAQNLKISPESVAKFFEHRSLPISAFRDRLAADGWVKNDVVTRLADPHFVKDITQIRQHPFLRIADNTHLVLDSSCVADLLSSGLYWSIFDSLPGRPSSDRERFRELWGRAFELYVVDLFKGFYGESKLSPLIADVEFQTDEGGGQIDAALDFGNEVILIEVKSCLLSLNAKCSGQWRELENALTRSLVENQKGKPKGVSQLARAAEAIIEGRVFSGGPRDHVFPVLVVDEKALECMAMNTYLNQRFRNVLKEANSKRILPLTLMSIGELEELLPYIAQGKVSWRDLLSSRFRDSEVIITSVHQALYNINRDRQTPYIRNSVLLERFERVFERVRRLCAEPEQMPRHTGGGKQRGA